MVGGLRVLVIPMAWLAGTGAEAGVPVSATQSRKADDKATSMATICEVNSTEASSHGTRKPADNSRSDSIQRSRLGQLLQV